MLRILYIRLLISLKEAKTLQSEAWLPPHCCSPKSVTPSLPAPHSHLLPTWLSSPSVPRMTCWRASHTTDWETTKCLDAWVRHWDSYLLPCSFLCVTFLLQPVPATTEPFLWNSPPQETFLPWWESMLGSTSAPLDSHDAFGSFSIISLSYRRKNQIVKEQNQL